MWMQSADRKRWRGVSRMDDRDILTLLLVVMMFLIGIAIGGHLLF